MNETEKARFFLIKAAEISSSNGNKWYESNFLERAGDISIKSDLLSQAKEDLINAYKAAYQTKDGNQKLRCLIKLLNVLDKLGELEETKTYGEEALSISRQIRNQNHEKIILNQLSKTYERLGDREKSLVYRLKAESKTDIHSKTWTIENSQPLTESKRNDYHNRIPIEFPKATSNNILIKINQLVRKTLRAFRNITFS